MGGALLLQAQVLLLAGLHTPAPASAATKPPTLPASFTTFSAVSAGRQFTCAVTTASVGYCWGVNFAGQVTGDGSSTALGVGKFARVGVAPILDVSAGDSHVCFVDGSNQVWCQGSNTYGAASPDQVCATCNLPLTQYPDLLARRVYCGADYSCFLRTDATLACAGNNMYGTLGSGNWPKSSATPVTVLRGVAAASAGYSHVVAVLTDGSVWSWGFQNHLQILGQPPTNPIVSSPAAFSRVAAAPLVASGLWHSCLVQLADGQVGCAGYNYIGVTTPTDVAYMTVTGLPSAARAVVAGYRYTVALLADGTMYTWGEDVGQTGRVVSGTSAAAPPISTPTAVRSGTAKAKFVSAGVLHFCYIDATTSALYCGGDNTSGDLGGVPPTTSTFVLVNIPGAPVDTPAPTPPIDTARPSRAPAVPTKKPTPKPPPTRKRKPAHKKPTKPTRRPTASSAPSAAPTPRPSQAPSTLSPTSHPSAAPWTSRPTQAPRTSQPSAHPTPLPTRPTASPVPPTPRPTKKPVRGG